MCEFDLKKAFFSFLKKEKKKKDTTLVRTEDNFNSISKLWVSYEFVFCHKDLKRVLD